MRRSTLIFSRAIFLACSWTWCIGMFLPVFLVKDFGVQGWIAFAIPNVIGAAAVGLIIQTKERSERIVAQHAGAMRVFSAVTVAYHFYFLGQILRVIGTPMGPTGELIAGGGLIALAALGARATGWLRSSGWFWFAGATLAISILAGVMTSLTTGGRAFAPPPELGEFSTGDLLWMTPGIFFGFLLCPHLDMTFHRVVQETPARNVGLVFLIGFCVFFLGFISFSLAYAASFLGIAWLSYWIFLHFFTQSVFTMGAHRRELHAIQPTAHRMSLAVILSVGALMGIFVPTEQFRLGYDLFSYTYVLLFPAYVWIVMIPRRASGPRTFDLWLKSVVVASPIFGVGYLGHVWWLLPISIALPLLAPLVFNRAEAKTAEV